MTRAMQTEIGATPRAGAGGLERSRLGRTADRIAGGLERSRLGRTADRIARGLERSRFGRTADRIATPPRHERASGCRRGAETASGTEFAKTDGAKRPPRAAKAMEGLSLIEVAIALAVSALLLGGLMVPLAAQIDRYRLRETEAALGQALEALLGYAAAHDNRLPCPDIDRDGTEDRPGPVAAPCRGIEGELPRATLGSARPGRMGPDASLPGQRCPHRTGGDAPAAEYAGRASHRQPAHFRAPDGRRSGGAGRDPLLVRRQRSSGRRERRHGRQPHRLLEPPPPRSSLRACGTGPRRFRRIRRRPRLDVEERAPRPAGTGGNLAVIGARSERAPAPSAAVQAIRNPLSPSPA